MNNCIRCKQDFIPRFPKQKICKGCTKRGARRGKNHWNYKDGSFTYETIRNEIKNKVRYCERCEIDLLTATHYLWAVHHKDHNHFNNDVNNLELLCKRCHQIEHECWKAFEGATTISKESTPKQAEAHSTEK